MTTMHQRPQSPLFALPAELRNRIYEHAALAQKSNKEPSILCTCRQIRCEGLKLFYAAHAFNFLAEIGSLQRWDAKEYHHFLTSLGANKAVWIEHLRFQLADEYDYLMGRKVEELFIDVTLDANKAEVGRASYSRGDVAAENVAALQNATMALNSAWTAHPNPTKAGLLRTLPALVPLEVTIGDGRADEP